MNNFTEIRIPLDKNLEYIYKKVIFETYKNRINTNVNIFGIEMKLKFVELHNDCIILKCRRINMKGEVI